MALNLKDLAIVSPDFGDGDRMDDKFTGVGGDLSPSLQWTGIPEGTRSLAVVCHDPDAPLPDGFTHWVLTGIPAETTGIDQGGGEEYHQGLNGWGTPGYRGPLPPPGHGDHRYYFWMFALDVECHAVLNRREFIDQFGSNVIEQARTVGIYSR